MRVKESLDGRSAELNFKDTTTIPEGQKIRMLRDYMIVEPLDTIFSAIIEVIHEYKPMRGLVKAIGPGHYPKVYNHPDKSKRTKMWDSKIFQPTEVKIGDIVELGGLQYGGYSFQTFYWGPKLHIICREADVAGVYEKSQKRIRKANGTH